MDLRIANAYNAYGVYNTKSAPGAKKPEAAAKAEGVRDTFTLSVKAEDYQTVRKALAEVPEIRTEKVEAIKARIAANAYHVSASEVAASIIKGTGE